MKDMNNVKVGAKVIIVESGAEGVIAEINIREHNPIIVKCNDGKLLRCYANAIIENDEESSHD